MLRTSATNWTKARRSRLLASVLRPAGWGAFTQLLKGLPLDTGMGFVLCRISIRSTKAYFGFFQLDDTTVARPRELGRKFPFSRALASAANSSQVNDER